MILAFYNNKVIILEFDKENLYLFQNNKTEIFMNHFDYKSNINKKETICKDCNGEFDITIFDGSIYLIYQDLLRNLILTIITDNNITNISMTAEPIDKIYELNIFHSNNQLNMVYLKLLSAVEKKYRIVHHFIDEEDWINQNVIDVRADQALNPIKLIMSDDNIILCFYNDNEISISEFNNIDSKWKDPIKLSVDNNRRLYLDAMKREDDLHLVYSQYQNNNYVIMYERYNYNGGDPTIETKEVISNESNCTNPTLVFYDDVLWIVWNESNRIYSRFSTDHGKVWSSIYYWKESIDSDLIRAKYLSHKSDKNFELDYSFGTLSPEIKFMGFGPLQNVDEVPDKKKTSDGIEAALKVNSTDIDVIVTPTVIDLENELEDRISILESSMEESSDKIKSIEEFLLNNTRGHFQRALNKKGD